MGGRRHRPHSAGMTGLPRPTEGRAPRLLLFGRAQLVADPPLHFAAERRFELLALLGVRSGEWVGRDTIAALFWPDRGAAEARRNLRKVVFDAHAVPGVQQLEARDDALRWGVETDLLALRRPAGGTPLAELAALRRGPLLDGLDAPRNAAWTDWLHAERARADAAWRDAVLRAAPDAPPAGRIDGARALLGADALDEEAVALLIDALQALGHDADAWRHYSAYAARLAEQFGVEPARSLRDRFGAQRPAAHVPPPPAAAAPADAGFVGRKLELVEAKALLALPACRVLTLLGPGGSGKSRLAQRLLPELVPLFPGGIRRVGAHDIDSAAALVARIAAQLGVALDDGGDALAQLLHRWPERRNLLVLDDAEALAAQGALIERLLEGAPSLTLLATSRTRLPIAGEWVLPLAGLAVPDEASRDLESAERFDAVRLFDARARAAQRGFVLARHLDAAIEIVEAVGGLPLAIELAACWVRLLPPPQIAQALRQSIDVLERDPALRTPPARPEHASLRAVLDGSWALLAPPEREALAALAVFRGGFTRGAALAVAGAPLPLLSALADKSLLGVDDDGRFVLHPVVGRDAAARLAALPGREAAVRDAHAAHQAGLLAALAAQHLHADPRPLVREVGAEFSNAVAAWRHAVASARADLLLMMVRPLRAFFELSGRIVEGIEVLRPALALREAGADAARALAQVRHALAMLTLRRGDPRAALALADAAADQAAAQGDDAAATGARLTASLCRLWLGDAAAACAQAEAALAGAQALGDRPLIAWGLGNLGLAQAALGRFDAAQACARQSLELATELGDLDRISTQWINLGQIQLDRDALADARLCFERALVLCTDHGFDWKLRYVQCCLGQALLAAGEHERARRLLETARERARGAREQQVDWAAELALARLDLADGATTAAAARVAGVAAAAHAARADYDVALAVAAWAEVELARGRAALAARLWRLVRTLGVLEAAPARALQARLDALAAECLDGADGADAPLALADALALIAAEGAAKR